MRSSSALSVKRSRRRGAAIAPLPAGWFARHRIAHAADLDVTQALLDLGAQIRKLLPLQRALVTPGT
jgi:hypothetical protein